MKDVIVWLLIVPLLVLNVLMIVFGTKIIYIISFVLGIVGLVYHSWVLLGIATVLNALSGVFK